MTKRTSIVFFLSVLVCSVIFIGCEGNDDSKEAAEARVLLPKVQKELARTRSNLNSIGEQLRMVRCDQLATQIRQLTSAHDDVVNNAETVGQSIDEMTAKTNEQSERIGYLENEINELNAVVENQRTTIAEQQSTIAELVSLIEQNSIPEGQEEIVDQQIENY